MVRSFFTSRLSRRAGIGLFVGAFIVLGIAVLAISGAASPFLSAEAESGALSGSAVTVVDAEASAGGTIRFGGAAATGDVAVDFSKTIATLDAYSFGGTMSGYGTAWRTDASGTCTNVQCTNMKKLGAGMYRVSIQWNNGNPVSGAGGNGTGGAPGDQMVDAIRAAGAEPMIVIGGKGGQNDMDFTTADAVGLITHYTTGAYAGSKAVKYWVVGNEPSNSGNGNIQINTFCSIFNNTITAMRQIYPGLKAVGPAWPYYDLGTLRTFLQCAGPNLDVLDYHAYGESSQNIDDNIKNSAELYERRNKDARAAIESIVPARASQIALQVGEYNVSPFATSDTNDARFYTGGTTVWNALATGSSLKGGGRAFIFSDQNNPIGMIFQQQSIAALYGRNQGDPQPAYHGVGMFTGEGLFRKFGTRMVEAVSTNSSVSVFASAGEENIVLVNKNPSAAQTITVALNGGSYGSADVWQTDRSKPFDYPTKRSVAISGNKLSITLPAYTVASLVVR